MSHRDVKSMMYPCITEGDTAVLETAGMDLLHTVHVWSFAVRMKRHTCRRVSHDDYISKSAVSRVISKSLHSRSSSRYSFVHREWQGSSRKTHKRRRNSP